MTSTQVVRTSVNINSNSPSQDYTHPDYHNLRTYDVTSGQTMQCKGEPAGNLQTLFFTIQTWFFLSLCSGRHKQEESLFEEMLQVSNAVVSTL